MRKRKSTHVQSLIFDKEYFTKRSAKAWAKKKGYFYGFVDVKKNTFRIRQFAPKYFSKSSFRTITLAKGVEASIGKLKPGFTFESKVRFFH